MFENIGSLKLVRLESIQNLDCFFFELQLIPCRMLENSFLLQFIIPHSGVNEAMEDETLTLQQSFMTLISQPCPSRTLALVPGYLGLQSGREQCLQQTGAQHAQTAVL